MNARNILVTGTNRGIGLELVRQLIASSAPPKNLFVTCRDPSSATELNEIIKGNSSVHVIKLDVQNEDDYAAAVAKVDQVVGGEGLNVLLNNAGVNQKPGDLAMTTREVMLRIYDINAVAPIMITKAFLPLLRQAAKSSDETGLSSKRAAVFNMSSQLGSVELTSYTPHAQMYSYRASKSALNILTMNLHRDLHTEGILCMSLHPGWVRTDMGTVAATVLPEESAKGLIDVMAKASAKQAGTLMDYLGETLPW